MWTEIAKQIIPPVATAIVTFVIGAIGIYGAKLLKKLAAREDSATVWNVAADAVRWVAQRWGTLENAEKFAKAAAYLTKKCPWLDADEIEKAIESAYLQMKEARTVKLTTPLAPIVETPVIGEQ